MNDRTYARRFAARKGAQRMTFQTLRRLHEDPRYDELSNRAARALDHALVTWADGENRWQVKRRTWADALGISERTLARAVAEAETVGLLSRTPYLRPAHSGQGASIYGLELAEYEVPANAANPSRADSDATRGDRNDTPCQNGRTEDRQGGTELSRLARGDRTVPAKERVSNENPKPGVGANAHAGRPLIGHADFPAWLAAALSPSARPFESYPDCGTYYPPALLTELEAEDRFVAHRFVVRAAEREAGA